MDCAGDVAAIADALGLDRFLVSGGSGPAGHGAWLGERVRGAEVRADTGAGHLATPETGPAELVALVEGAPA